MKSNRQSQILELIREHEIETQNQLMEALAARGIKSTQATLSRDIKELRLIKKGVLSFLHSPTLTSIHDHWKNHSLD